MSRKHFEAIAAKLKESKPIMPEESDAAFQWRKDCIAISEVCSDMNPAFNQRLFLAACGYPCYV